jgi:hypothetical protein
MAFGNRWWWLVIAAALAISVSARVDGQASGASLPVSLDDLQVLVDQGLLIRVELNASPPRVVVGVAFVQASADVQQGTWAVLERFVRQARPRAAPPVPVDANGNAVPLKYTTLEVSP